MTTPVMSPIEIQRIPREETSHEMGDSLGTAEKQEMNVIGHQHPCGDPCLGGDNELTDTTQEGFTIRIISKDVALLDPPYHDMVEDSRSIQPSLPWHL
jgi:hypothetical protein